MIKFATTIFFHSRCTRMSTVPVYTYEVISTDQKCQKTYVCMNVCERGRSVHTFFIFSVLLFIIYQGTVNFRSVNATN
jgi:hypothetical protein